MRKLPTFLAAALGGITSAMAAHESSMAATAVNTFGLELHQRLAGKGAGNLCISPYSIQTALSMTFAGADGATREEMARILHYPTDETIHRSFQGLQKTLEEVARESEGEEGRQISLNIANRLFGQQGYDFKKPFRTLLESTYGAPMEELDFAKSTEKARTHINGWVEKQTKEKIKDLIPVGVLDRETRLVLVNAIYIKAPWSEHFSERMTKPAPFHVNGGKQEDVRTMVRGDDFGYAKRDGYTAVSIPYAGGRLHFVVLVPDEVNGLAALEKSLKPVDLAPLAKLPAQKVILHLPKFKLEPPSVKLGEELQAMGMKKAFDKPEGSADFSKMAERKPNEYLYISEVVHKTFIALDEKGTEAAAATAVVMARATAALDPKKPVEVRVDRPFLFAVQHVESGACLFLGRITDPR